MSDKDESDIGVSTRLLESEKEISTSNEQEKTAKAKNKDTVKQLNFVEEESEYLCT